MELEIGQKLYDWRYLNVENGKVLPDVREIEIVWKNDTIYVVKDGDYFSIRNHSGGINSWAESKERLYDSMYKQARRRIEECEKDLVNYRAYVTHAEEELKAYQDFVAGEDDAV
jgi:hypothetical protein